GPQDPDGDGEGHVRDASRKLEWEVAWVEQRLRQIREAAAGRALPELEQGGEEEGRLADRAHSLSEKGQTQGVFPERAADLIGDAERAARQAADAFKRGDAQEGLGAQAQAQRDLEAARQQMRGEEDEAQGSSSSGDGGKSPTGGEAVDIPGNHKGPEEFRRRVLRGLGSPGGDSLKDAVKRYAEGLLR
ncbi:MAG: hypothetical protein ACREJ3_11315, partial [Polyangiaceae bacterium]